MFKLLKPSTRSLFYMPELISKLQYKNYEKGEYTGEKARGLEETLQLVKTFPWQQQRGTDIQLTGPSVTLLDDSGNYLKVGLYFGDKFCIYYFTGDHHLYEYHVATYDEIAAVVTDFFEGRIETQKFERNRLVFQPATHFEDAVFCYQVKAGVFYGRLVLLIVLALLLIGDGCGMMFITGPLPVKIILPAVVLALVSLLGYQQYRAFQYYHRSKSLFLKLSAGSTTFSFGEGENIREYNKPDIAEINIYGPLSGKTTPILTLCELVFINGTTIVLPGMLIPPLDVMNKFIGVKVNRFERRSEYIKQQSAFARGE